VERIALVVHVLGGRLRRWREMGLESAHACVEYWEHVIAYSWGIVAALALGCVGSPLEPTQASPTPNQEPSCVVYRAEARYSGVGYDHLVHISNQCDRSAACDVSTNVNPDKMHVVVASKSNQTLLTWRGSPAREFKATVTCRLSE